MRCEEALGDFQQDLLGQPVDPARLEAASVHIAACQELCARTLGAAPEIDLLYIPEQQSGQTDRYEALGLAAEEEGDAHARRWRRLARRGSTGKAAKAAIEDERALALACWQAAANYYQDGLRLRETAFLREGMKRLTRKRLEPPVPTAARKRARQRQPRSETGQPRHRSRRPDPSP